MSLSEYLRHPELYNFISLENRFYIILQLFIGMNNIISQGYNYIYEFNPNHVFINIFSFEVFFTFEKSKDDKKVYTTNSTPMQPENLPELPYVSPELLLEGKVFNVSKSTIYSICCMFMEFLLDRPFLHGKDLPNQMRFIVEFGGGFPTNTQLLDLKNNFQISDRAYKFMNENLKAHITAESSRNIYEPKMIVFDTAIENFKKLLGNQPFIENLETYTSDLLALLKKGLTFYPPNRPSFDDILTSPIWKVFPKCSQLLSSRNIVTVNDSLSICISEIENCTSVEDLFEILKKNLQIDSSIETVPVNDNLVYVSWSLLNKMERFFPKTKPTESE
jgi:serine/threonine protein kinase